MGPLVADTHALAWYLLKSDLLSRKAFDAMEQSVSEGNPLLFPTVGWVEMVYLAEKGRISRIDWLTFRDILFSEGSSVRFVPLDGFVAQRIEEIPRHQIPDFPDRIIAATALHLGLPLVTRDGRIRSSGIETIW